MPNIPTGSKVDGAKTDQTIGLLTRQVDAELVRRKVTAPNCMLVRGYSLTLAQIAPIKQGDGSK